MLVLATAGFINKYLDIQFSLILVWRLTCLERLRINKTKYIDLIHSPCLFPVLTCSFYLHSYPYNPHQIRFVTHSISSKHFNEHFKPFHSLRTKLALYFQVTSSENFTNSLDPDQTRQNVGSDLVSSCLTF